MSIGFLRSSRSPASLPRTNGESRPVRASKTASLSGTILADVERLGVGLFWATDAQDTLIFLSSRALHDFESAGESPLGQPLTAFFHDTEALPGSGSQRALGFKCRSRARINDHLVEVRVPKPGSTDTQSRWWRLAGRPLNDSKGRFLGYRGSAVDITAQYLQEMEAALQSQVDELTGLANRRRIGERLGTILAAFRQAQRSCALMMLDLDRFKQVNDTMGHHAGDDLLQQVARRLVAILGERCEIGRLGGDEFQILLPDMDDRGALSDLAQRIVHELSQPYQISGKRANIGASIGIAIAPYDGLDAGELTHAADMALYAAKETRGSFRFFTSGLNAAARQAAQLVADLREAAETGKIEVVYQPVVDPVTSEVKVFEALLRWDHPDHGPISPAIFIPLAEEHDLILMLGEMALNQACRDALRWPESISVAVNVSAKQFMKPDFHRKVATALEISGLSPPRLELEITENIFAGDHGNITGMIEALHKLGVRLVLDDFGTGYSSLGYLKHGHFDKIKIDQSFVHGCTASGDTNPAIITAIVALAKALGITTVAEGVEAMDELALVRERGADLVQGFIYASAMTQAEVLARFAEGGIHCPPAGPPRYRSERITILRKVGLIHEDHYYDVLLRNLSKTGARIAGLAGVPVGTEVVLDLGHGQLVVSTVVNSTESSQGLKFETSLISDGSGGFMTRHRISPYALAEAGIPLAALGAGSAALAQWRESQRGAPKFVQLELGS